MTSSNSSNYNSSSKNSSFSSFLKFLRSRNYSNIELVNGKSKQSINTKKNKNFFPKKLKWYDVVAKYSDGSNKTLKKPRSNIPIVCKNECPKYSCCIRVVNLSRRISVDNLYEIFSEYGTIININLHFNYYDRISKGFSYIMFSTPEESENAVESMNKCEVDGHDIICELWFLPYTDHRVSSILRDACSRVGYRSLLRCIPPIYATHYSSELDRLRYYSRSPFTSIVYYDNLTPYKSNSGSANRSRSRSPRQSRLRSRSNSQSMLDYVCSKSSRFRSSKKSYSRHSRKPY